MPAERAGYTVTMFLVDLSPSMGASRTVVDGHTPVDMTKLERCLQYVKMKIQEMIFNGRKTDQCGVVTFGSEDTNNIIHDGNGGYEHVSEYIPIGQPNAATLAQLDELCASETAGDPVDGLIVAIETQERYLERKRTWTRKIVLVTDGESPMEVEEWEAIVKKMSDLRVSLTVVGVDFDDKEFGYQEEDKAPIKRVNEDFYARFISSLPEGLGLFGTLEHALVTLASPSIKEVKSSLVAMTLRLGDVDVREDEAIELQIRVAKCTNLARAAPWKKFFKKAEVPDADDGKVIYKEAKRHSEYIVDRSTGDEQGQDVSMDVDEEKSVTERLEKVEKEQLIKGFKYGSTYVPCPDGQFPRLNTRKGMEICGFFSKKHFNRSYPMSEMSYVYACPNSVRDQLALSSIAQAMYEKGVLAIARMVTRDGMDPKMGILYSPQPEETREVDLLLWVQMPFADDVRRYTFPSLNTLRTRSGEIITKHPYLPTEEQLNAMDDFVDGMDLMEAAEDEQGKPEPWFDPRLSYNPAVHRTKQAQFHAAVVSDVTARPLPPPHPELTKYFNTPKRVLKTARSALEECKAAFKVKEVPKRVPRTRKDGHVRAQDEDEDLILLDQKGPARKRADVTSPATASPSTSRTAAAAVAKKKVSADDSATESESDEELLLAPKRAGLPTPTASPSPEPDPQRAPGRIIGNAYPLRDFRQNLRQGDVVTKAVEDLGVVVREIVQRPFASRRTEEMVACLKELREACLREDEVDAWNGILRGLKEDCMGTHGNVDFWAELCRLGRPMSLISAAEAKGVGTVSDVDESAADAFIKP